VSERDALEMIRPEGWPRPSGYSDGVLAPAGARLLFVAGEVAWDERQALVGGDDMAAQFRQALANVCAVVRAAGGEPRHLASMTVFVTDKSRYIAARAEVGAAWRAVVGKHVPAMALVEVKGLVEPGALVEIQAVAALPAAPEARSPKPEARSPS
jgi:enamine deaminase RidA (YjgF/YER057c/UK114 family)